MAKNNMVPMPKSGGVMGKLISIGIVLALITLIVKYPHDAASWATNLMHGAGTVIDGFVAFARAVFGG